MLVSIVATSGVHAGQVYRWVDGDGRVHYGDRPPAGSRAERVTTAPAAPVAGPEADRADERRAKQHRILRAYEKERLDREKARDETRRAEAERALWCKALAARIEAVARAQYLYRKSDGPGGRDVLSDEERKQRSAGLEAAYKARC